MTDYNLTADELLLVYLTFLARDEEGHPEYFKKWFDNGGKDRLRDLFNSLKQKQVILKNYNPDKYIPNEIQFNQNFLRNWIKYSYQMGQELFDSYPPFLNIQGKYVPLKDISKRFNSLEEFYFFYGKEIGHNPSKHKHVMDILQWSKDNGYLNVGILNFVLSHQWESYEQLRKDPSIIPIANTESVYQTV